MFFMFEKKLSGETLFKGHVFTVEKDIVDCGGFEAEREVIRHPGGVAVLAMDEAQNIIMVRQYRYAVEKILLELPAGRLEPGEDPMNAALRELSEETGYIARHIEPLGQMIPTGGYDSEIIHLYFAKNLQKGTPHPDIGEIVTPELIPFHEATHMALSGEIDDGKTIVGIFRVMGLNLTADFQNFMKNPATT